MYHVYIIECEDSSLYTGITTNLERRFLEHSKGRGGHYTRSHKPKSIIYSESQPNRSKALKREAEIKRMDRISKLELTNLQNKKL